MPSRTYRRCDNGDVAKPADALSIFPAICLDKFIQMHRTPWARREFLFQFWFMAWVSPLLTILLCIPFWGLLTFDAKVLAGRDRRDGFLRGWHATGQSNSVRPAVTVVVVTGAGAPQCAQISVA